MRISDWSPDVCSSDLWWRDDDAGQLCPALERLLDCAAACRAPLALAVIPDRAAANLAATLAAHPADPVVLQHGYAHTNHAPAGAQKRELLDPALRPAVPDALARGRERPAALFRPLSPPAMVAPWNPTAAALAERHLGL